MASAGIGADLEGFHAIAAALRAGRLRTLVVEASRLRQNDVDGLVTAARSDGVSVEVVDDVRPFAVTGAPQGLVAEAHPIEPATLAEVAAATTPPAVLVLDHLEDPRNVGAVARSAVAAGVRGLVVTGRRAAPLGATAFKTAAGAFEQMTIASVNSIGDALSRLGDLGVWTVGLDGSADASLFGHHLLTEPVALVIGAEGHGLGRLVRDRLDATVRIPMAAGVESLNASVAASLAVFELARARGWVT